MAISPTGSPPSTRREFITILRVLGWEFARRIRVTGLLFLLCMLLVPWLLFQATLAVPQSNFQDTNYYPAFYGLTIFLGIVLTYEAQKGMRAFLACRPLTTKFIFAWLLGTPIVTIATTFAAANAIVHLVYGVDWPWVRPLLWLVFFVVLTKCAHWRVMVGRGWEALCGCTLGALAVFCFVVVQGGSEIDLQRPFTGVELIALAIATCATVVVGYRSFDTMRSSCGDVGSEAWFAMRFGKVEVALSGLASTPAATSSSFSHPLPLLTGPKALEWLTWRQVGIGVIAGAVVLGCASIAVQILGTVDYTKFPPRFSEPHKLFEVTVVMFMLSCFGIGSGIGLTMATMVRTPGDSRQMSMSVFHAVRPISNQQLHRVYRRAMFRYCVLAWLVVIALASTLPLIAMLTRGAVPKGMATHWGTFINGFQANSYYSAFGSFSLVMWVLLGFLVMWSFAGVTSSASFFGNDRALLVILCLIGALAVTACFLGLAFPNQRPQINVVSWTIAGLVALGATLTAFRIACRDGLVDRTQLVGAVAKWALLAALAACVAAPEQIVGVILLSSLVEFGLATGPIGLIASRHR